MNNIVTLKSNPNRWQVLADMAYAMEGGRPGGGAELDYLDEALRAFPASRNPMADFGGHAVRGLLLVLRDRHLRRALRGRRSEHGDC